jgi:hypothetical protein
MPLLGVERKRMGKFRPQIFLAIGALASLAGYGVLMGNSEVAAVCCGGIIALSMKVLEGE